MGHLPKDAYAKAERREREETANVHADADARCGRDWLTGGCTCGACRQVRAQRTGTKLHCGEAKAVDGETLGHCTSYRDHKGEHHDDREDLWWD